MAQYKLSQNDKDPQRTAELENRKKKYTFYYDLDYPVSVVPPPENEPPVAYYPKVLKPFAKRRSCIEAQIKQSGLNFQNPLPKLKTIDFASVIKSKDLSPLVDFFMPDPGPVLPNGRPSSVQDYEKLFLKEPLPETAKDLDSDAAFANTFLGGSNPDFLKRMNAVPAKFPISDAHFKAAPELANDNLQAALTEGRVYFTDFAIMEGLSSGKHPQGTKYMYAPLAAFAVPRGGSALIPFAIQTGQTPQGREIYTPNDKWSWKLARSTVQVAANAHSALITHLSLTHFLMEPIILCLYRNVSPTHPIFALVHPHTVNTNHINFRGLKVLIGKDQFLDRMIGSSLETNYALMAKCRREFDFKANYFPQKIAKLQTDNAKLLPQYAYRDDGLLLWSAIKAWVSDYVSFYYRSEADLRADIEIQNWAREIGSEQGGQVRNFAGNGGMSSVQELIDTITMIIFISGPQHASVNFVQRTDMCYVPTSPLGGFTAEMRGKSHSEKQWLDFLPPLDIQSVQNTLFNLLGSVYFSRMDDYGKAFSEAAIIAANKTYSQKLVNIEATINSRNQSRRPYIHLLPSKIPQSINI